MGFRQAYAAAPGLIDCDVHQRPASTQEWAEHLAEPYRSEVLRFGERTLKSGIRFEEGGNRDDAVDAQGRIGGVDPRWTAEHLLDSYRHRFAILSSYTSMIAGMPDPDYAAAVCSALNDHTLSKWIPADPRYVMGIHVPLGDPVLAVREIERLAGHPLVVCILISAAAHRIPLGNRYYWPIYEAAARHGLPLHLHPSTTSVIASGATTPTGMASTYLQVHTCLPQFYMSDLVSLVLEGVFEKFPQLRVAFIEGGICWLPPLLWRMDKEFKSLRQQAPHLRELPSRYVRRHCRFGTQPIEEPQKTEHLVQLFNMLDADHTVVYASDYPHYDFDPPEVLPPQLGAAALQRILHDNAFEFFRFPKLTVAKEVA